jgi:hypothetical protein
MSSEPKGHGMSGAMTMTVNGTAYQQMEPSAAALRTYQREIPAMLRAVQQQNAADLDRMFATVGVRQDDFERSLAGLSSRTRRFEQQTSDRLKRQAGRLRVEIRLTNEQTRDEQERRLVVEIERERFERERDAAELRAGLSAIESGRERAEAAASTMLTDGEILRDAITGGLPHERFAPARLATLDLRLSLARTTLAQGLTQAALASARETYLQLTELRAELERLDQAWRLARVAALGSLTVVAERIRYSKLLPVPDEHGGFIEGAELDVDYWSLGELSRLVAEVTALSERAGSETEPLTAANLRLITEQDAPDLTRRLDEIVKQAAVRKLASQIRINVASVVVSTLRESGGYEMKTNVYAGNDQREANYSYLRDITGEDEIVVEVAPDEAGGGCTLRVLSFEHDNPDEEVRSRRAHVLVDSLRAAGLSVSDVGAERAEPVCADYDLEKVLQRRRNTTTERRTA